MPEEKELESHMILGEFNLNICDTQYSAYPYYTFSSTQKVGFLMQLNPTIGDKLEGRQDSRPCYTQALLESVFWFTVYKTYAFYNTNTFLVILVTWIL
jgi:hypothetical protein